MVRTIRYFVCIAFLSGAIGAGRTAHADDKPKAEKKDEKKLELPKLPEGSNPKWDFAEVEEKFTIVKGSVNEKGAIYFLLELKEDMTSTPSYKIVFTDAEGVKYFKSPASCDPANGKKGDRVRLVFFSAYPATSKDTWSKAVSVKFVSE